MQVILDTFSNAFQENLEAVFLLIVIVGTLCLINIILGTIIGTQNIGFNVKKFLYGFLKALIISICIFCFCYMLNLLSLTLDLIDINISVEVITVIEVIMVLTIWAIDYVKEIYEKMKSLKELKFVSYEDVNDYDTDRG